MKSIFKYHCWYSWFLKKKKEVLMILFQRLWIWSQRLKHISRFRTFLKSTIYILRRLYVKYYILLWGRIQVCWKYWRIRLRIDISGSSAQDLIWGQENLWTACRACGSCWEYHGSTSRWPRSSPPSGPWIRRFKPRRALNPIYRHCSLY